MSSSINLPTLPLQRTKCPLLLKPTFLARPSFGRSLLPCSSERRRAEVLCSAVRQEVRPTPTDLVLKNEVSTPSNVVKLIDEAEEALFRTGKFGRFGGFFVPETLVNSLEKLAVEFDSILRDPDFQVELAVALRDYVGRETPLYFAQRLTDHYKRGAAGGQGPEIYLKREDLNHGGAHKINNAIAQAMIARRMGLTKVVASTGAGQHGVATAAACAKLGLDCTIVMGDVDMERQSSNVLLMKHLGAKVKSIKGTFKDATSEAIREWVGDLDRSYFLAGTAVGPHPCPSMVREFQSVIGKETRRQAAERWGGKPDVVVACVGGGSNALGIFHEFVRDEDVRLVGVEAAGTGIDGGRHSATLARGDVGVYHGAMSYLLQDEEGQIIGPHSIGVGLEYPGVSPELSFLKDIGRAEFYTVTDQEALNAYALLCRLEGIFPALEAAHALAFLEKLCPMLPDGAKVVVNCSGCGDKDAETVFKYQLTGMPPLGTLSNKWSPFLTVAHKQCINVVVNGHLQSLKTLVSQSRRKISIFTPFRAFFCLGNSCHSPSIAHFLRPSNSYIRRHFLFRSRFFSPVSDPKFPSDPPWRLSQSVTPFLVQSDVELGFFKLRALNLLHRPAFPYNLDYDAKLLLRGNGGELFTKRDGVNSGVVGDGISDSYLNPPNFISVARLLSGPLLGWMIFLEMYSSAFVGLAISGATDWLDGDIARKMAINSVVGSYLDPLADKVLIGCAALAMVEKDLLHLALVVVRDVALVGGAFYKRASSLNWKWNSCYDFFNLNGADAQRVEPLFISKVNTVFQLALVAVALLQPGFRNEETHLYICCLSWLVASTTVASTVGYGVKHGRNGAALTKVSKFRT